MKVITINLWCPHVSEADNILKNAGIKTARFATPFRVSSNPEEMVWAVAFNYDSDGSRDEFQIPFNVGWVCGLLNLAKDTTIDYEIKDMVEDLKV